MRIGAYELSSQMNIYSRLSSDSIKRVDNLEKTPEVPKAKGELDVTLSIDGRKELSPSSIYSKYPSDGKVLNPSLQKLDDFSLVSSEEDKINTRFPEIRENGNYKEIISDDQMDSFLKKAFKLYDVF